MRARALPDRIERAGVLDRPGDVIRTVATAWVPGRMRDLLHGVWLGHPLHPVVVLVTIGSWFSGTLLAALRVKGRGSTILITAGCASAIPTAIAGFNDWMSSATEQRRTGLVHATANVVGQALYLGSLGARLSGNTRRARRLAYAGLVAVGAGGYLGGDLSYRQAAGVSHAEPLLRRVPEGWHGLCDIHTLTQGKPEPHTIGEVPVLVTRIGDRVTVMVERCGHQLGSLSQGELRRVAGADCVVCPRHGSTFRLSDGIAVRGPAGTGQPMLRTRIVDGQVEARLP